VEAKATTASRDDGDLAFKTEDVAKVLELDVSWGGHGGRRELEIGGCGDQSR